MNSLIYGDAGSGGSEIYTLSLTSQFMPVRYAELILYGKCWKGYAVSVSAPPKIPDFDANIIIFNILL